MLITADQLLAHAIGDYVLQSDWMAKNKVRDSFAALIHAAVYSYCFLPLCYPSHFWGWLVILITHFLIDRFRLARYVVYAKNWLGVVDRWALLKKSDATHPFVPHTPVVAWVKEGSLEMSNAQLILWKRMPWAACSKTGYPQDVPDWMAVWLLIIADNICHVLINGLALRWL